MCHVQCFDTFKNQHGKICWNNERGNRQIYRKTEKKTTTRNGKQESNLNLFKAVLRTHDGILGYLDLESSRNLAHGYGSVWET